MPSQVVDRHRAEIRRIAKTDHAGNVRVFGSVGRGEDTTTSDVDILVTFEPEATLFDQVQLVMDLEALLDCPVDVVSDGALGRRGESILADMLEFAALAAGLVARGKAAYDEDVTNRLAAEAIVHRLGEAVTRLPERFVAAHPEVAWSQIEGTRNIVAHQYGNVDHELLWRALATRLPEDARKISTIRQRRRLGPAITR